MSGPFKAVVLVALLAGATPPPRIAASPQLRISFHYPEDFELVREHDPSLVYVFRKQVGMDAIMLTVAGMGGPIAQEKLKKLPDDTSKLQSLPGMEDARLSVEYLPWRDFTINALRTDAKHDGVNWLILQAQVPLVPQAVNFTVVGPTENEQEMREALMLVLPTVSGETNWLTKQERLEQALYPVGGALVVLVIALRVIRARRKEAPQPAPPRGASGARPQPPSVAPPRGASGARPQPPSAAPPPRGASGARSQPPSAAPPPRGASGARPQPPSAAPPSDAPPPRGVSGTHPRGGSGTS
ncbi:MAG TPA: hypothetical protein VND93_12355 [Myxococcales bacterium]|nr:hypothetical protein [Myxococcales bacterium]